MSRAKTQKTVMTKGEFLFQLITDLDFYEAIDQIVSEAPDSLDYTDPEEQEAILQIFDLISKQRDMRTDMEFSGQGVVDLLEEERDNLSLAEFLFVAYDENSITEAELEQLCKVYEQTVIFWNLDTTVNFTSFPSKEIVLSIEDVMPHEEGDAIGDDYEWLKTLIANTDPIALFIGGQAVEAVDIRLVISESEYKVKK